MLCGFSLLWRPFGWNWSYLGFLGIIWRMCGSKCRGEGGGIFLTLCVECCLVIYVATAQPIYASLNWVIIGLDNGCHLFGAKQLSKPPMKTTHQLISPWTKWPPIWQTTFSNAFSWMKMIDFRFKFHWIFFSRTPIANTPALVQVMAWRRKSDKPLPEPMMTQLIDAYIQVTRERWVNHVSRNKFQWTSAINKSSIKPSLIFVKEIHRWLVDSPHKSLIMHKVFQYHDVIITKLTVLLMYYFQVSKRTWDLPIIDNHCLVSNSWCHKCSPRLY